jgi:signal peptidase I
MLPTLNIGDLIIVQKIDPAQIHADPLTGDILVYKRGDELIVHRAISIRRTEMVFTGLQLAETTLIQMTQRGRQLNSLEK